MSTDLQDSAFTEGNILFLKKLSQIDEDLFCSYNIPEGALFHPALVIQLTEEKKDVQVCIVRILSTHTRSQADCCRTQLTTLNDHDLDVRRDLSFERFIAIHPKAPLWKDLRQLCLMNGVEMRKEGYLDVRKSYTVHRSMLMPYDWISRPDHYRLTARIYAEVAEILKIKTVVRIEDRYTHQMTRLKHLETELMKLKAENERLNERLHRKLRGMRSTKKLENHEGTEGVAEASQIN